MSEADSLRNHYTKLSPICLLPMASRWNFLQVLVDILRSYNFLLANKWFSPPFLSCFEYRDSDVLEKIIAMTRFSRFSETLIVGENILNIY